MTVDYNLVVLGATPAGIAAAIAAARVQARVALVAQSRDWPLDGALRWPQALRGLQGLRGGRSLQADYLGRFQLPLGLQSGDLARLGVDVVLDKGRFERRGRDRWVQVGERRLRGQAYLLAPGPMEITGAAIGSKRQERDGSPLWVAENLAGAGARVTVVGDQSAGLSLAQVLAQKGRSVTLLTAHGTILCPSESGASGYERYDRELAYLLQCHLEADGVVVRTQVSLDGMAGPGSVALGAGAVGSGETWVRNQGVRPDFEGWGLEAVGLGLQDNGRPWSANLRSQVRSIWVCGLASDSGADSDQPWIGEAEARHVVRSLLGWPRSPRPMVAPLPWVVGTTTPLVSLGLTEDLARAQRRRVRVLRATVGDCLRGQLDGQPIGELKIIADRQGRIIGAHALSPEAPEWMGTIGLAMQQRLTLRHLSQLPIASPTYAALMVQLAEPSRSARQDYWAERWFNWRRTGSV